MFKKIWHDIKILICIRQYATLYSLFYEIVWVLIICEWIFFLQLMLSKVVQYQSLLTGKESSNMNLLHLFSTVFCICIVKTAIECDQNVLVATTSVSVLVYPFQKNIQLYKQIMQM